MMCTYMDIHRSCPQNRGALSTPLTPYGPGANISLSPDNLVPEGPGGRHPSEREPESCRRARNTSSIAAGHDVLWWSQSTIVSDAAPSRCPLRKLTTPSLASSPPSLPPSPRIVW